MSRWNEDYLEHEAKLLQSFSSEHYIYLYATTRDSRVGLLVSPYLDSTCRVALALASLARSFSCVPNASVTWRVTHGRWVHAAH